MNDEFSALPQSVPPVYCERDGVGPQSRRDAQRFLRWFFGALVFFLLPLAPVFGFLYAAGEIIGVAGVVRHQIEVGGVYSSDTINLEYQHHLALNQIRQTTIVALGSSRVGTLAPDCFAHSFVNLTGMLRWLPDADDIYSDIVAVHKPEKIVVGIDHNWFHPDYRLNSAWARNSRTTWAVSGEAFRHLADLVIRGKLTFDDILRVWRDDSPNLGIQAKLFGAGTDGWGVRHWGLLRFPDTIPASVEAIRQGETQGTFFVGGHLNEKAWRYYLRFLERAKHDGIQVVGYLTPLPPSIIDAYFATGEVDWLQDLRQRVKALPDHIDFFDPRGLGIADADFLDESHIGNQATRQLCEALTRRYPM